jgi:hypothetical protein
VTDEIVAFLEARLAEDETLIARNSDGRGLDDGFPDYRTYEDSDTKAADEYIARFGPGRQRREVAAKRERLRLLGIASRRLQDVQHDPAVGPIEHGDAIGRFVMVLRMVALDAATWSDHADYKPRWSEPNWRPE